MKAKTRPFVLIVAVLLVLVFSAARTMTARAADGTPPPDATPAVGTSGGTDPTATPPVDPGTSVDPVATATDVPTLAPTDAPTVVPTDVPTDVAPADPGATADPVTALMSQVPAGTDVVVLDASGQPLPLGSTAASDAIAASDPIWCPAGVAPSTLNPACVSSATGFNGGTGLVNLLKNSTVASAGTIWIVSTYSGEGAAVNLSSATLSSATNTMVNFALTIQGGWSGTNGTTTVVGNSVFNAPLNITNWGANVTINNVTVSGSATGPALSITTTGATSNIVLSTVNVTTNSGAGAVLTNTGGAGTGNVTVSSSTFSGNHGTGLSVNSNGTITLTSVTASSNTTAGSSGIVLNNSTASTPKGVSVSTVTANSNTASGLSISSAGTITVSNATTNLNGGNGVVLSNTSATTPQSVTISGTNSFSQNTGIGLSVTSKGAISANNINANSNPNNWGAVLDNSFATSGQSVTLTGTNTFNMNAYGLRILSKGAISVNSVSASSNTGDPMAGDPNAASGAWLDNCLWTGSACAGSGSVTMTGTNTFNSNSYRSGLAVISGGAVNLANVTANSNGFVWNQKGVGVYVNNYNAASAQSVNLTGTNVFTNDTAGGLVVTSRGAIAVSNVTATGSTHQNGVSLDNHQTGASGNVTVSGTNVLNSNNANGLYVLSNGAISVSGTTADSNNVNGAWLDNTNAATAQGVTISSASAFSFNSQSGLVILSKGAIALTDVDADQNSINGASLDNTFATSPQNVTLSGVNTFSQNSNFGLWITSKGSISANNVIANSNSGWGAILDNSSAATAQSVTLSGTLNQFKDNQAGLKVLSKGSITLNSVVANNNMGDPSPADPNAATGAWLDNCLWTGSACAGSGSVTLTGTNVFNGNRYRNGLSVISAGAVNLSNLTASENGGSSWPNGNGVYVNNYNAVTAQSVNVTGTNVFTQDEAGGLVIISRGAIAVSNVTATNNSNQHGVSLDNHQTGASGNVTVSGTNVFTSNHLDGLYVLSNGAISVSSVTADSNGQYGAWLDNTSAASAQAVSISGTNEFSSNSQDGLHILSKGAIAGNNITADSNSGYGVFLDNTSATTVQSVSLSGTNKFDYNSQDGLKVQTKGAITLNNIYSYGNHGTGATLINNTATLPQPVTLTGTNTFNNNFKDGLDVLSKGAVSISNAIADYNGVSYLNPTAASAPYTGYGYGMQILNNADPASHQNVTISGVSEILQNWMGGLLVESYGTVSLASVKADSNGYVQSTYDLGANNITYLSGIYVDNCGWTGAACANATAQSVSINGTNQTSANHGSGVYVTATGAITLNGITAESNHGYGVFLDNSHAITAQSVNLSGTNEISYNPLDGLHIQSVGAITLNNVTSTFNTGENASLVNNTSTLPQPVNVNGTNIFYNGHQDGLYILTKGAVTLNNITADNNGTSYQDPTSSSAPYAGYGYGILILNNAAPTSHQNVTINGSNDATNNWMGGLLVESYGAVSVNSISTSGNGSVQNSYDLGSDVPSYLSGIYVDNCGWTGSACANTTALPVSITGTNVSNYNLGSGIYVTATGAISLNAASAQSNGQGWGVYLQNDFLAAASPVTLGTSIEVNNNSQDGLYVISHGAISVANLGANNNGASCPANCYGAVLINNAGTTAAAVTLSGSQTTSNNHTGGLEVLSKGVITVASITAEDNNNDSGVFLDNTASTTAAGISVTGSSSMHSNAGNGLIVKSNGPVTIGSLNITNNQAGGVIIDNSTAASVQNVTLSGPINVNNNFGGGDGLDVTSRGAISITNLNVTHNAGNGAVLDNSSAPNPQGVTIGGSSNTFGNNHDSGLVILSKGTVAVSYYNVNSNTLGDGININNTVAGAVGSVTVTQTQPYGSIWQNAGYGLSVQSLGAITLNNVTSTSNGSWGAYLINNGSATPQPVTLAGGNIFNNNDQDGLFVLSKGTINASVYSASGNSGSGAVLSNNGAGASGGITLSSTYDWNGSFGYNNVNGITITSLGPISLSNVVANGNQGYGASLNNASAATAQPVTVSGNNAFNSSITAFGLNIVSKGAITLSNIQVTGNHTYGASLDNTAAPTPQSVTISGSSNSFSYNHGGSGLDIETKGTVNIANLDASQNTYAGALVNSLASGAAAPQSVTLTGTNQFGGNGDSGLTVNTFGGISMSNVTANNDGNRVGTSTGYGVFLDNCQLSAGVCTGSTSGINITGTNSFNYNYKNYGLWAVSRGPIAASNLYALGNHFDGVYLSNQFGLGSTGGITISGSNIFQSNNGNGLTVLSQGAVTLNNLDAESNGNIGVSVNTHGLTSVQSVTLTGNNIFTYNSSTGLSVVADGNITTNNLTTRYNGSGVSLDNHTGTGTITVNGTNSFLQNYGNGLSMNSHAAIVASNIVADKNSGNGITATSLGTVTIQNASITNNNGYGWALGGSPTVTVKGVFAFGNSSGNENLTAGSLIRLRN